MRNYLILAVRIKLKRNPLRPFSWIDLGHVDIIVWVPPGLPEAFGFYPVSYKRVLLSALVPQRAKLIQSNRFTRIPAYWHLWKVSEERLEAVRNYLKSSVRLCSNGFLRYDAVRFNCLHLAYRCLQIAGLNPPSVPLQRVWFVRTLVPLSFIKAVMPDARYSIMDHELDREKSDDKLYKN